MPSASRPSQSKGKNTPKIGPAWVYYELQANGRYAIAVSHGESPPPAPKSGKDDPTYRTEPKPLPAHLLGEDGISPKFGEIEKLFPRPIREGEHIKMAKEELKRHVEEGTVRKPD